MLGVAYRRGGCSAAMAQNKLAFADPGAAVARQRSACGKRVGTRSAFVAQTASAARRRRSARRFGGGRRERRQAPRFRGYVTAMVFHGAMVARRRGERGAAVKRLCSVALPVGQLLGLRRKQLDVYLMATG